MGPLGAGLKAKLARNLVQYGSWLAAYEAQVLAEAAGIELAKLAAGDQGERQLDRRRVDAHVPRHRGAAAAEHRRRLSWTPWRAGAALAHKDLRGGHGARPRASAWTCPLAAMTDARCDAVFGIDRAPGRPEAHRRTC